MKSFTICLFSAILIFNHCPVTDSEEVNVKVLESMGLSPMTILELQRVLNMALLNRPRPDIHGPPLQSISVGILETRDFTDDMTLKAVEVLTRAVMYYSSNPCEFLREHFLEQYPEYDWQCVDYNMYSIGTWKSINMQVGNKRYLLFATIRQVTKEKE